MVLLIAGGAAALWLSRLDRAFVEEYSVSPDGRSLTVFYYPAGPCDEVLWERVRETDTEVVVDVMALKAWPWEIAPLVQYGCEATFALEAPLGDRVVTMPGGKAVTESARLA